MSEDLARNNIEPITTDTIPIIIDRIISSLRKARTFSKKEEAIKIAAATVDAFESAKKINIELEEKLEMARREIIVVIIKVKVQRVNIYDKAKKAEEVHGQGRSKKSKEKTSEPAEVSEKPKQKDLDINFRRLSEDRKVASFEKDNPGTITRIIKRTHKDETVSRNIGHKVINIFDKNKDKKKEEIEELIIKGDEEKRRFDQDMKNRNRARSEAKSVHMIVREYESQAINNLEKAKLAIERITEIIRVNNSIALDEYFISVLNKWRYFLAKLHEIYPFESTYDPNQKSSSNEIIILEANKEE
jgi:hypothetical protein